ncbi:hypothetical protein C8F01DRAFT_447796 [Mycena amicta]|nr:hypothetical protein C8F01DRAFT_447796 [Mycena amicta]
MRSSVLSGTGEPRGALWIAGRRGETLPISRRRPPDMAVSFSLSTAMRFVRRWVYVPVDALEVKLLSLRLLGPSDGLRLIPRGYPSIFPVTSTSKHDCDIEKQAWPPSITTADPVAVVALVLKIAMSPVLCFVRRSLSTQDLVLDDMQFSNRILCYSCDLELKLKLPLLSLQSVFVSCICFELPSLLVLLLGSESAQPWIAPLSSSRTGSVTRVGSSTSLRHNIFTLDNPFVSSSPTYCRATGYGACDRRPSVSSGEVVLACVGQGLTRMRFATSESGRAGSEWSILRCCFDANGSWRSADPFGASMSTQDWTTCSSAIGS